MSVFPTIMTSRPQWVCANGSKVPKTITGRNADPTNPADWSTFEAASAYATPRGYRLGFCLTADDPLLFIDLDKCRDPETGAIEPWAVAILDAFPATYVEVSASGTGLHIIGLTTRPLPATGRKRGKIEMYDCRRYVVLTGDTLPGHDRLADITEAAAALHRQTFLPAAARPTPVSQRQGGQIEDDAIIERASNARNGAKFDALFNGDTSGHHGDDSAADLAFLSIVAFWSQDPDQLDRLFRRSGLMREKWERQDYRERTIRRALERSEVYSPPAPPPKPQDASLANGGTASPDDLPDDVASLKLIIVDLRHRVEAAERRAETAEARAQRSAEVQSKTVRILGNPNLGQERITAVALAYEFAYRESAGDVGDDHRYRLPLARLAERAGVSEDAAGRHIKKLEEHGVISKKVVTVPETINDDGVIIPLHRELYVGPITDAVGFVDTVATLEPAKPKPKWGGAPRCLDHPDTAIIKRVTWECADCGQVLQETTETIEPNPQDASLEDPPVAAKTAGHTPPVVNHYSSALFTEELPPGSIAAEWLSGGRSSPAGESPGSDRWTA